MNTNKDRIRGLRLDRMMVLTQSTRSRSEAVQLITEGKVSVNGKVQRKSSTMVSRMDLIEIDDSEVRYVSRAGQKLAGALKLFDQVNPEGLRCLDAGASTGGFTDVLLRAGAGQVLAVDVGHGQLVPELHADPRVKAYEGYNIRDIRPEDVGGPVSLIVSDLSFISLKLVVEPLAKMCEDQADLILMVKPQFEVGRQRLPRSGVVMDPQDRRRAVEGVLEVAAKNKLAAVNLARSALPGQQGNVEFFLHLRRESNQVQFGTDLGAPENQLSEQVTAWIDGFEIDWT